MCRLVGIVSTVGIVSASGLGPSGLRKESSGLRTESSGLGTESTRSSSVSLLPRDKKKRRGEAQTLKAQEDPRNQGKPTGEGRNVASEQAPH